MPRRRRGVVGHRGCRGLVPENTLPSIERALDLRVDGIEIDLHLSGDGQVLVSHDPVALAEKCRSVGGLPVGTPWASLDLVEIQQSFVADRNPDPAAYPEQDATWVGRHAPAIMAGAASPFSPPSLAQVVALLKRYGQDEESAAYLRRVNLYLEIKRVPFYETAWLGTRGPFFETGIVEIVRGLDNWLGCVTVLSFDPQALKAVHRLDPWIEIALLTSEVPAALPACLAAVESRLWCPNFLCLRHETLRQAHDFGLDVLPWTVNSSHEMQILREWGIEGMITDFPNRLSAFFR